ncbi:porin [Vibrio sp. THAF190c]|uniref:porin n=1 Tax=Vibrio sp. THAF190c TaxID=2587865 RepID=UPI001268BF5C|nr:porin [Vibrio sp. THAF190c]QFT12579.1 hypothetical protein FIV04_21850 [Vibrio sp. THAF190c]
MKRIVTSVLGCALASPAFAVIELTDSLSLSGFGSTSWARSDNDTLLMINRGFKDENCYDCDTTFGLQLDYYLSALRASVQVVKRPQDDWNDPALEWAYIGYEYNDFDFSVGRLRLPLFLASEYYYVGQAYMTARPPTEVYNSILGITAFNGAKVSWNYELTDEANLQLTPFYGINDENEVEFDSVTDIKFTTNRMFGVNMVISGDNYRWNAAFLDSNFDQKLTIPGAPPIPTMDNQHIQMWSLGTEYEFGSAVVAAEAQTNDFSSSFYTSFGYHLGLFTPYAVYGAQFNDHEHLSGNSYTIGVDYDVLPNISLNGEVQYFEARRGTGSFIDSPTDDNAMLYTIMLNFVF